MIDNWLVLHVEAAHPLLVVTGEDLESYYCKTYGTLHRWFHFLLACHKDDKITFQLYWWWFHPRQYLFLTLELQRHICRFWLLFSATSFANTISCTNWTTPRQRVQQRQTFQKILFQIIVCEPHPDNACNNGKLFKRSFSKSLFPMSRIRKLEPLPICKSNQQFSNWL